MSEQEQRSASGLPGLAQIPFVNNATSSRLTQNTHNQLMVVVTPHILRSPSHEKGSSRILVLN